MNKAAIILIAFIIIAIPYANARVDARFIIKNEEGRQIYMITPDKKIIFGNVVAGEKILFDASASSSAYKVDRYYWDFNGDGKWDRITTAPKTWYVYSNPGTYNATLMAVASSAPPMGDGDVVRHLIKVVKELKKPVVRFTIEKCENDSYEFNASSSYDPDGYIKSYRWDFDGDGKWDISSRKSLAYHSYTKNGFYEIKLEVTDYDTMKNFATRVIEIKEENGEVNETKGVIKVKNEMDNLVELHIIINNYYNYTISVGKKEEERIENVSLSSELNEIHIFYEAYENKIDRVILLNFSRNIKIIVDKNTAYIEEGNKSGYEIYITIISLLSILFFKKIKGKD